MSTVGDDAPRRYGAPAGRIVLSDSPSIFDPKAQRLYRARADFKAVERLGGAAQGFAGRLASGYQRGSIGESRAGQLLREMEKAKAGRPPKNRSDEATDYPRPATLKDLHISKDQSSDWQKLAAVLAAKQPDGATQSVFSSVRRRRSRPHQGARAFAAPPRLSESESGRFRIERNQWVSSNFLHGWAGHFLWLGCFFSPRTAQPWSG